jgi:hypothetical protein
VKRIFRLFYSFLLAAGVLLSEVFFELAFELVSLVFDPPSADFDPTSDDKPEPADSVGADLRA